MRLFIGITDSDWLQFLSKRHETSGLDEVNFWQPRGSTNFRALSPSKPFLFKLHSPQNYIVGGGFFAHFTLCSFDLAWQAFGESNGAPTRSEMRDRIIKYRRADASSRTDFVVGCVILVEPFFFPPDQWIRCPSDFSANIVRGKGYDATVGVGKHPWGEVRDRLQGGAMVADIEHPGLGPAEKAPMFGIGAPRKHRLGQGAFRMLVTDNYERRCAVSREKTLPVLEAAHIQSVELGGRHLSQNGILLRSDIHKLFDKASGDTQNRPVVDT